MLALVGTVVSAVILAAAPASVASSPPAAPAGASPRSSTPPAAPPITPPIAPPTGPAELGPLTEKQWADDVDALVQVLATKHVDAFSVRSKEAVQADAEALKARLKDLTVPRRLVALAQLAASIGDQHTSVALDKLAREAQLLPVALLWLEDGVFIAGATAERQSLIGRRVARIGGRPVEEVLPLVTSVTAVENDGVRRVKFGQLASSYDLLHALGLVQPDGTVAFDLTVDGAPDGVKSDGAVEKLTIAPLPPRTAISLITRPDAKDPALPVSRRPARGNYFMEKLGDPEAIYLRYDRCLDDPAQPFAKVADAVIEALSGLQKPKLVIDLRNNGGGNSKVMQPLIEKLVALRKQGTALREPGSIVVLVGPRTQSSASMNAFELRQRLDAKLVGLPTGQKPNHLGEVRTIQLPNTGLTVWYSTKRFRPIEDDSESLVPSVRVPMSSADWFAGRDPAMDEALGRASK